MRMPLRSWKKTLTKLGLKLVEKKPTRDKRKPRAHQIESLEAKQLLAADLVSQENNDTISTAQVADLEYQTQFVIEGNVGDAMSPQGAANEVDLYQVEMVAGQELVIDVDTPSSSLDSYVRVFDDTGAAVPDAANPGNDFENDDEAYGQTDSYLTFKAPSTGTFYVGVSSSGNDAYDSTLSGTGTGGNTTGDYTLNLTRQGDIGDITSNSEVLDVSSGSASISSEIGDNDVDLYKVDLVAGQQVTLDIETPGSPDDTLDSYVRVFDSSGNILQDGSSNDIENDDEAYGESDSLVTFTAPSTGSFYVGVSSAGNSAYSTATQGSGSGGTTSGDYTLNVSVFEVGDTTVTSETLDVSSGSASYSSKIGDSDLGDNDVDLFKVDLVAGQEVTLDIETPGSPDDTLDSYIRVFDNSGNILQDGSSNDIENDDESYGETDSLVTFTAPSTGSFYVGVSSAGNTTYTTATKGSGSGGTTSGDYTLNVNVVSDIGDTTSTAETLDISSGSASVTSDIGDNDLNHIDVDLFQVSLVSGQQVTLDIDTPVAPEDTLDSYVRVFDSSGNILQDGSSNDIENDDEAYGETDSLVTFTASSTGTFYVGISSAGNSSYSTASRGSGSGGTTSGEYTLNVSATNPGPEIAVEDANDNVLVDGTSTFDFGNTLEGTSVSHTFEIHNEGTADLTLGTPTVPAGFTLTSGPGSTTLTPGSSTTFTVELDATNHGSYSGTVSFTNNDSDEGPFDFDVSGTVIDPATIPEIEVSDENFSTLVDGLSTINLGTTTTGSPIQRTLTIRNLGPGPLTLDTNSLSLSPGLSLVTMFNGSLPNANDETTLVIQLDASSVGSFNGNVSFESNDTDESPFDFTITAQIDAAPEPEIKLTENSYTIYDGSDTVYFGTHQEGTAVQKTFTIENNGNAELTLDPNSLTLPTGYSLIGVFPSSITAGNSDTFILELDTTTVGTYAGSVSFTNNDIDEATFDFDVDGEVIPFVPDISVSDEFGQEGTVVDFVVTLSAATSVAVTVDYATAAGTGTDGVDYTGTTGQLTFTPGETSKTVSVTLLGDQDPNEGTETFVLNLSNAIAGTIVDSSGDGNILEYLPPNEAPTVANAIFAVSMDEDEATYAIDLSTVFDDVNIPFGDSLTYAVTGNTDTTISDVTVSGSSLNITPVENQNGSSTITIEATDEDGLTVSDTFLLTIDAENDVPTLEKYFIDHFVEMAADDIVIDLSTYFADLDLNIEGDNLTYTVTNSDNYLVVDSVANDELTLDIDEYSHGQAEIVVRATDNSGAYVEDTFRVYVSRSNDAPTVVSPLGTVNIAEDAGQTSIDLSTVFDDADLINYAGEESLTYLILQNSNAVTPGESSIVSGSVVNGQLLLEAPADAHGQSTLKIRAVDQFGEYVEDTFTVSINAVNDVPTIAAAPADILTVMNSADSVIDLSAVFADVDVATSADQLTYTVENVADPTLLTAVVNGTDLTLGYLTDQYGTSTVTIRATDLAGEYVEHVLNVDIAYSVSAPTVTTPIADITVDEDGTLSAIDLTTVFDDVDIALVGDSLSYEVSIDNEDLLTGDIAADQLQLTLVPDAFGVASVTVTATDQTDLSVTETFLVTISSINDAPVVNIVLDPLTYSAGVKKTVIDLATLFADNDIPSGTENLTFTVESNSNIGLATAAIVGDQLVISYTLNPGDTITTGKVVNLADGSALLSAEIGDNALADNNDVDLYEVELVAGQVLTIDVDTSDGSLDSFVRLFDDAGTVLLDGNSDPIENDDESGTETDSLLTYTATTTGTYFIGVSSKGNESYSVTTADSGTGGSTSGEYTLQLTKTGDIGDTTTNSQTLDLTDGPVSVTGEIGNNTLSDNNDVDLYKVELVAGQQFTIDIDTPGAPNNTLDSYIRVFDNTGAVLEDGSNNPIDNDDEAYGETDSLVTFTAATTGTYYIGVSSAGNSAYSTGTADSGTGGTTSGEYTLNLTNGVTPGNDIDIVVKAEDSSLESVQSTISISLTDYIEDYIGKIDDLELVNDTTSSTDYYDDNKITFNASVIGRVNVPIEDGSILVEFDHDGDGTVEGHKEILPPDYFDYEHIFYNPQFEDDTLIGFVGTVDLNYRPVEVDASGIVSTYRGWDSFQYTLEAPPVSTVTSTVSLEEDTGASSSDKVTSNPGLVGTTPDSFSKVEFDLDADGQADRETYSDSEGNFDLYLVLATYGSVTVDHRTTYWDAEAATMLSGPWTSFTFTLEEAPAPDISSLILATEAIAAEDEDYEESGDPVPSSLPLLVGTIDNPDEEDLAYTKVEIDLDNDGIADDAVYSDETGLFSYLPQGITAGNVTVKARTVILDFRTDQEVLGNWTSYTFEYSPDPTPEVEQFKLINDSGSDDTDKITEDTRLTGRLSFTTGVDLSTAFVEFDHDNDDVADGLSMPSADGTFVYRPGGLAVGSHTIRARVTVWDNNLQDFAEGVWTSITFTKEAPTNIAATLGEFGLDNDNGVADDDDITTDPTLTGSVSNDGPVGYWTIEFDHDGDGLVDGTTIADGSGNFVYVPIGIGDGVHTVSARVQEWDYTTADLITNTWQDFTFTVAAPVNNAATVDSLFLVADTGTSSSDNITANTLLAGTTSNDEGFGAVIVEFDYDNDSTVDGYSFTDSAGNYTHQPLALDYGSHTIQARTKEWDYSDNTYILGTWTSITIDYQGETNTAANLVSFALANDTGASNTDLDTSDPTVVGSIINGEFLEGVTIDIDTDNDGTADTYTTTDRLGQFSYAPEDPAAGSITLKVRTREFDHATGTELLGSWSTLTFTYTPTVLTVANISSVELLNDTGDSSIDKITTDATLIGQVTSDRDVSGLQIQIDSNDDGVFDLLTTTDESGNFEYRVIGLTEGAHTIALRVKEYDSDLIAVYSNWTTFDFTLESLVQTNTPDILNFDLLNDTGNDANDYSTADGTLTGTLSDQLGSGNITIEFDHNSDGIIDGTTTTIAGQTFSYLPEDLKDGYHNISARVAGSSSWESLDFVTADDPDSVSAQEILGLKSDYELDIQNLESDFQIDTDLTNFDYDSALAAATAAYDTARANAQAAYETTVNSSEATFKSTLDAAIAAEQAARASADAQFVTDLAAFEAAGNDITSFQFNSFSMPDAPNIISYQLPDESTLPQAPKFTPTDQLIGDFDHTQDPQYQDDVATAEQDYFTRIQDDFVAYNNALNAANQAAAAARATAINDFHTSNNSAARTAEVAANAAPLTAGDDNPNNPGTALTTDDEGVAPDVDEDLEDAGQEEAEAEALNKKNGRVAEIVGADGIIDIENYIMSELGSPDSEFIELIPEDVIYAAVWVVDSGGYDGYRNSGYDSKYASELETLISQVEAIEDALAAWTPDPNDDIYEQTAAYTQAVEGAEYAIKTYTLNFWKSMNAKENEIDMASWSTLKTYKDKLAEIDYEHQKDAIEREFGKQSTIDDLEDAEQTGEDDAEADLEESVSIARNDAQQAEADIAHDQRIAQIQAQADQELADLTTQDQLGAARVTARDGAFAAHTANNDSAGAGFLGRQNGHQSTLDNATRQANSDQSSTEINSRRDTLEAIADEQKELAEEIASLTNAQNSAAKEKLISALKNLQAANKTFVDGETAAYKQAKLDYAKADYDELKGNIDNYNTFKTSQDTLFNDNVVAAEVGDFESLYPPGEDESIYFTRPHYHLGGTLVTSDSASDSGLLEIEFTFLKAERKTEKDTADAKNEATKTYNVAYQDLLHTNNESKAEITAGYQTEMVSLSTSTSKQITSKQSATANTIEGHKQGHSDATHQAGQTAADENIAASQTHAHDSLDEYNDLQQQNGADHLAQTESWNNDQDSHWSQFNYDNVSSFVTNTVTAIGNAINTASKGFATIAHDLSKAQTTASINQSKGNNSASIDASKSANSDGSSATETSLSDAETYAIAMINAEKTRDVAQSEATKTYKTTEAEENYDLQKTYIKTSYDRDIISLDQELYDILFNWNEAPATAPTSPETADQNLLEANLTAQVTYAKNMSAAEVTRVTAEQGALTGFAASYQSAANQLADDSESNSNSLADKDKATATTLNDTIADNGETAAKANADAQKTAHTESASTQDALDQSVSGATTDEQNDRASNAEAYEGAHIDDHKTAMDGHSTGGTELDNLNADSAANQQSLFSTIVAAASALRSTISSAVSSLASSMGQTATSSADTMADAGKTLADGSAEAAATQTKDAGTAVVGGLVAALKAENKYSTTTSKAAVDHYVKLVNAESAKAIAIAQADDAWVSTVAPAKKTFILDDDQSAYDSAVSGANSTRTSSYNSADTAYKNSVGSAITGHATAVGGAITTRASGIGSANTGAISGVTAADSGYVSKINGAKSGALSKAQSAESQQLTETQQHLNTFSNTANGAADTQQASVNTGIDTFVTDTVNDQFDYHDAQATTDSTNAAALANSTSDIQHDIAAGQAAGQVAFVNAQRGAVSSRINGLTSASSILGSSLGSASGALGGSVADALNSFSSQMQSHGHGFESSALGTTNTFGQTIIDAAGDYHNGIAGAGAALGNELAGNYDGYLQTVIGIEVAYMKQEITAEERASQLLDAANGQINATATADYNYAESSAGESRGYTGKAIGAVVTQAEDMAGHNQSLASNAAGAEQQLDGSVTGATTTAWASENAANNAYNTSMASTEGAWVAAAAGAQKAGVAALHASLNLPYTQFLVDKFTALESAATNASSLYTTAASSKNAAADVYNTAMIGQYTTLKTTEASSKAALAQTMAASEKAAALDMIGSFEESETAKADAVEQWQKDEAEQQKDLRSTTETAERQHQEDDDDAAKATAISDAEDAFRTGVWDATDAFFEDEIGADFDHQIETAERERDHANNTGAAISAATAAIGAATKDYRHAEADNFATMAIANANADSLFETDFMQEVYDEIVAELTGNTDPWSAREISYTSGTKNFVDSTSPAQVTYYTSQVNASASREKDQATTDEQAGNDKATAEHQQAVDQLDNQIDSITAQKQIELDAVPFKTNQALTRDFDQPEGQATTLNAGGQTEGTGTSTTNNEGGAATRNEEAPSTPPTTGNGQGSESGHFSEAGGVGAASSDSVQPDLEGLLSFLGVDIDSSHENIVLTRQNVNDPHTTDIILRVALRERGWTEFGSSLFFGENNSPRFYEEQIGRLEVVSEHGYGEGLANNKFVSPSRLNEPGYGKTVLISSKYGGGKIALAELQAGAKKSNIARLFSSTTKSFNREDGVDMFVEAARQGAFHTDSPEGDFFSGIADYGAQSLEGTANLVRPAFGLPPTTAYTDIRREYFPAENEVGAGLNTGHAAGAGIGSAYAAYTAMPKALQVINKAQISSGKFDYLFGNASGLKNAAHNAPRTAQNLAQMKRLGLFDDANARRLLQSHFDDVVNDTTNITKSYSNKYGNYEVRQSLFAGPSGKFAMFESTWEVLADGTRRLTTVIPIGG